MQCRACGERLTTTSNFCAYCGVDLRAAAERDGDGAADAVAAADRHRPSTNGHHPPAGDRREAEIVAATRTFTLRAGDPTVGVGLDTGPLSVMSPAGSDRVDDEPLRACPCCAAPNGPHRSLCGRCGADLDPEIAQRPLLASHDAATEHEPPPAARGRRRLGVAALLSAAALVGAAIGGSTWVEQQAVAARPVFDVGVYPGAASALTVAGIGVPSGGDLPGGQALIDADPRTVWTSKGLDTGVGEEIIVRFDEPVWVSELSFWADEAPHGLRPARVGVEAADGRLYEVVLGDLAGEQAVSLPDPVLVRTLRLQVLAAHPGTGTVEIAGLQARGWPARGADRDAV